MGLKATQPLQQKDSLGNATITINKLSDNDTNGIQSSCDAEYNRRHLNVLKFDNGITIEYPNQDKTRNASIQSSYDRHANQVILTNMKNVSVFAGDGRDHIKLEGCENCTVDTSKPDMKRDDVIITDSKNYASKGNVVYLSDESYGEGFVGDFAEIHHSQDKHPILSNQYKFYAGQEKQPNEMDDSSWGEKKVTERSILFTPKQWMKELLGK